MAYLRSGSVNQGTSLGGLSGQGGSLVGTIAAYGNNSTPNGWLLCDGTAVNRSTYSALFAAIGTSWGAGDSSTTFNLPDLEGAFLRGTGSHGSSNMANGSDFAGPSVAAFANDAVQGHKHGLAHNNSSSNFPLHGNARAFAAADSGGQTGGYYNVDGFNTHIGGGEAEMNNGAPRTDNESKPFSAGVKYCIKY